MKFEVFRDARNEYRWRFKAANGQIVAVSGEGYHNKQDCLHGIALVKQYGPNAPVDDQTKAAAYAGYRRW